MHRSHAWKIRIRIKGREDLVPASRVEVGGREIVTPYLHPAVSACGREPLFEPYSPISVNVQGVRLGLDLAIRAKRPIERAVGRWIRMTKGDHRRRRGDCTDNVLQYLRVRRPKLDVSLK